MSDWGHWLPFTSAVVRLWSVSFQYCSPDGRTIPQTTNTAWLLSEGQGWGASSCYNLLINGLVVLLHCEPINNQTIIGLCCGTCPVWHLINDTEGETGKSTRANSYKLEQEWLRLCVGRNFFSTRTVKNWRGCPKGLCIFVRFRQETGPVTFWGPLQPLSLCFYDSYNIAELVTRHWLPLRVFREYFSVKCQLFSKTENLSCSLYGFPSRPFLTFMSLHWVLSKSSRS